MTASVDDNEIDWVKVNNSLNGKSYYWKVSTLETMFSIPPDIAQQVERGEIKLNIHEVEPEKENKRQWQKVQDKSGRIYWWNVRTDETSWDLPVTSPAQSDTIDEDASAHRNSKETVGATGGVKMISGVDGLMQLETVESEAKSLLSSSNDNSPAPVSMRRRFGFNRIGSKEDVKSDKKDRNSKSKKDATLDAVIRKRVKGGKGKLDVSDVVDQLEMSSPFEVEHKVHVHFDEKGVRYSGLPSCWAKQPLVEKAVFGVSIIHCPRLDVAGYVERIPAALVLLKQSMLDLDGHTSEGLFRLAPDKGECDAVKAKLNDCAGVEALKGITDPQVPANLIKQFFRELQPNLLNCLNRDQLRMYIALSETEDLAKVGAKVADIPEPEHSCLLWLLDLLAEVSKQSVINRMTPKNLAIVISPNLYDMQDCPPMEALVLSQKLATLVENLLIWRLKDFHEDNDKAEKALTEFERDQDQELATNEDESTAKELDSELDVLQESTQGAQHDVIDHRASNVSERSDVSNESDF